MMHLFVLKQIDGFLNSITMYRLVLYGLIILATLSLLFSFVGLLPYSPFQFIQSLTLLLASCYISNFLLSKIFKAPTNYESYLITGLILYFILSPITQPNDIFITAAAGVIAMSSKYFLAIQRKHLFNPAAVTVFLLGLVGFGNGIWWVGSSILLPFITIIGLLIVRKIRRFYLLWSFILTSIATLLLFNLSNQISSVDTLQQIISSWPLLFFGTIMLTEPLTTPPNQKLRLIYGAIVGFLFGSQFSIGPLFSSPELALVLGNVFSYFVSPKYKLFLTFKEKTELAPNIYQLVFKLQQTFSFQAGQYLEWTIPHHQVDSRGNRRYFTIASSPTELDVKLGIKMAPNSSSSFKKSLVTLKSGDLVTASQLTGDFILPADQNQKLVFIAGGIGVTPFRSMLQYLIDTKQKRQIVFFYSCISDKEFVYKDIFAKATADFGLKMVYVITDEKNVPVGWTGEKGYLTPEIIKKYAADFGERSYYLSGPSIMVDSYKSLLHKMGIKSSQLITDYFPGF